MNLNFVQVWKFIEDQKKSKWNTFSPNSGEDKKKRSSSKIEHFFPQIQVKTKTKKQKGIQRE